MNISPLFRMARAKKPKKSPPKVYKTDMPITNALDVKPISVNDCWQGRRFKTPTYSAYEKKCLLLLPARDIPPPPYRVTYEFHLSNRQSDLDNPVKPFQDILQKKYGFNDADIYEAVIRKVIVPKGKEAILFTIETLK